MVLSQSRFTLLGLNPNDVATFIVVLILSLPVLLEWSRRWGWLVWPVETILVGLLVGTGSRGGVMALLAGIVVYLVFGIKIGVLPFSKKTWLIVLLALLIGVGAGLAAFPKGFRLGSVDVTPEASAGRRIEVWSKVPEMLASAPDGWGSGKAADAYEQWFEAVGQDVELKHLLSSHLTWLVEFGLPLRWLYFFLWMGALVLLIPERRSAFTIWGLAVGTAFLIALFYNAAGKWWNWPLPVLWLMAALISRGWNKTFPPAKYWLWLAAIAGILTGIPFVLSSLGGPNLIRGSDSSNIVVVGKGDPSIAVLGPDKRILGTFYGQEIRKEYSKAGNSLGSILVIAQPDAKAASFLSHCRFYVISGANDEGMGKWESTIVPNANAKLILINCRVKPDDWISRFGNVSDCRGEFYGDPFLEDWKTYSAAHANVSVQDIPRHEAYIADWWSLLDGATSP